MPREKRKCFGATEKPWHGDLLLSVIHLSDFHISKASSNEQANKCAANPSNGAKLLGIPDFCMRVPFSVGVRDYGLPSCIIWPTSQPLDPFSPI